MGRRIGVGRLMDRPFRIRHPATGRSWSFATNDAAMARLGVISCLPSEQWSEYEYTENGVPYDVPRLIDTMQVIQRIVGIGNKLLAKNSKELRVPR